jgi:hypothetical protein
VANYANGANTISEFNNAGAPATGSPLGSGTTFPSGSTLAGTQVLDEPYAIAINGAGNLFIANAAGTTPYITQYSPITSAWAAGTGGGLFDSSMVAIDATNNVWLANPDQTSISEFNDLDAALSSSSGLTGGEMNYPKGLAIDTSANVWIANESGNTVSEYVSTGVSQGFNASGYQPAGVVDAQGIAIDAAGHVWVANSGGNSITEFTPSTCTASGCGNNYGSVDLGLDLPVALAIDGAGNVWVLNAGGGPAVQGSLSELNSSGALITSVNGYGSTVLNTPESFAIDGSGNIWVTNSEGTSGFGTTVTEFVGLAAPVVTPIAANLMSPYGTSAVNLPGSVSGSH